MTRLRQAYGVPGATAVTNAEMAVLEQLRGPHGEWTELPPFSHASVERLVRAGYAERREPLDRRAKARPTIAGLIALDDWRGQPAAVALLATARHRYSLTPRQKEVYDFIVTYIALHGTTPTMVQIAEACAMKSRSQAHRCIVALEERGWLQRGGARKRSIMLLGEAA